MKRVTITIPDDVADAAKQAAEHTGAPNFSVFVTDALRVYIERETISSILGDLDAEFGPTPPESKATARKLMNERFGKERPGQGTAQRGGRRDDRRAG